MRYLLGQAVSGRTTASVAGITIFLPGFWLDEVQCRAGAEGPSSGESDGGHTGFGPAGLGVGPVYH